jgi:benzoyl-CoA reductase/2-hydroxyglutaryl-CoA dehydratase subunit BcrC/BadD/HgdB
MASSALDRFAAAAADPTVGAAEATQLGYVVIRTLGFDAPVELIRAAKAFPVRLIAPTGLKTPNADRVLGDASMGTRGKRLLEQLLVDRRNAVLITHADAIQPQLFAALRELSRLGEPVPDAVHFLDLLHLGRDSSRRYNESRLVQLTDWLADLTGHRPSKSDVEQAIASAARQQDLIRRVGELRRQALPKLAGADMLNIVAAAQVMSPETHMSLLEQLLSSAEHLPGLEGTRVYLCGTPHDDATLYEQVESLRVVIVGEDHEWGECYQARIPANSTDLCDPRVRPVPRTVTPQDRAARIADDARKCGAEVVIHVSIGDDEAAPWDIAAITEAVELPLMSLKIDMDSADDLRARIGDLLSGGGSQKHAETSSADTPHRTSKPVAVPGGRSRKSLQSLSSFGAYQREWFAGIRSDVAAGAPFAVVNANAPQEILRAMGIPFVVNQWWASIVAAKQQSGRYLQLLKARNYPTKVEAYSSQGLAAAFDMDEREAPWGGLPKPDFLHAAASSDPTLKIFDEWARVTDADCFVYERTIDPRWSISSRWWEELPDNWDQVLEPQRIDLMVDELSTVIGRLEQATGRSFSKQRFETVMTLVNEQEEYYRLTRNLIAGSSPAPISIVDSMPATMVPQWHRGTEWARDAAKAFFEEVRDRVENGLAAAPQERVRLMWVGRGLWSDMGFYQKWEESHGAVFVWSMYLAIAADGYIRRFDRGRDPMRALAARFITMGDELRMPTWAGPWYVHEAQTHRVDGAVALRDADPFVVRALQEAGIPVLELPVDNFAREGEDASSIEAAIREFIEGPATSQAEVRHVAA